VPPFFSFEWPSVAYALDILAWDLFFGLSMLFAARVFSGDRLQLSIRMLMIASGVLALAGMSGVVVGDMQLRMIGVVGYAVLFPVVALLLTVLFGRTSLSLANRGCLSPRSKTLRLVGPPECDAFGRAAAVPSDVTRCAVADLRSLGRGRAILGSTRRASAHGQYGSGSRAPTAPVACP